MSDSAVPAASHPCAELISDLAAFPEELVRLLDGYSVEALSRPASDGGWGVVESLGHLRDWDDVFMERATAIVEQDRPDLPNVDDELWEIEHDYRGQDPRRTLEQIREQRRAFVALLRELPLEAWDRSGRVAHGSVITLHDLAEEVRVHDAKHLAAITDALA